jgi:hypothetical protein
MNNLLEFLAMMINIGLIMLHCQERSASLRSATTPWASAGSTNPAPSSPPDGGPSACRHHLYQHALRQHLRGKKKVVYGLLSFNRRNVTPLRLTTPVMQN